MDSFARLHSIVHQLRGPEGCPWDREQTHESLLPALLEEVYEMIEAVRTGDMENLREELGDFLLHAFLQAEIAAEEGHFNVAEVAGELCEKLIRRHPHVFGEATASSTAAVEAQWEAIKAEEKKGTNSQSNQSALGSIPPSYPALLRAQKIQRRAAKVGFDWPQTEGIVEKIAEECRELEQAQKHLSQKEISEELGDLLFSLVNLVRHHQLDAELLLQRASDKFVSRFQAMEKLTGNISALSLEEMEALWQRVKRLEKTDAPATQD